MDRETISDEEKLERRRAIGRAKAAKFRAAHPEKIKENNEKYSKLHPNASKARSAAWRDANPDRARALNKRWQQANPDKVRLANSQWAARNREKACLRIKKYQKAHPEKGIELSHRRRARLMACDEHYTVQEMISLRKEKGKFCANCGTTTSGTKSGRMTIDHIIALSNGGSNGIRNIQFLCLKCNASKGNRY